MWCQIEAARRFGWHGHEPKPQFFSQPPLPLSREFTVAEGEEGEQAGGPWLQLLTEAVDNGWGKHPPARREVFTWPEGQFEEPRLKRQRRLEGDSVSVHPEFLAGERGGASERAVPLAGGPQPS